MIIKDIEKFKGETMCLTLLGKGEAKIYLNRDIAAKYSLSRGMTVTADFIRSVMRDNDIRRATERALYLLEYRERSRRELHDKLRSTYNEDICQAVCDRLEEKGIIDDYAYAEHLTEELSERRHYGRQRIRQELYRRGIDSETISDMIRSLSDDDAAEQIVCLIRQKYADKLAESPDKVKNALARRGYTYSQIKQAVEAVLEEEA
ncbi:MAG: regulatory protein RecX [Oscillospiraceae bacterium]|nr:regulatory protein RecX [Oscillospiraceae bacterium]MBQ8979140.1 regulatory protein RecX [Oscillospiraceae bacterium]